MSNVLRIENREISYEQAKEMLFPELIPKKGNEAVLAEYPHDKVEDLAVVYRLDLHSEDGTTMSARVNQAILDAFGVISEQMKQDALENAPKTHPATFRSMEEVLSAMMGGIPMPEPMEGQPRFYVASVVGNDKFSVFFVVFNIFSSYFQTGGQTFRTSPEKSGDVQGTWGASPTSEKRLGIYPDTARTELSGIVPESQ